MKLHKFLVFIVMSIFVSSTCAESESFGNSKLQKLHTKISTKYTDVKHIESNDFLQLDQEQLIIFDVRDDAEYRVSHLKNAIQIDPEIKLQEFVDEYSETLKDKTVVFYCSVGERSSMLAAKLQTTLNTHGAQDSFNLVGGLFQWHNEKRTLMQDDKETKLIHPYNRYWGRLIDDKDLITYTPQ